MAQQNGTDLLPPAESLYKKRIFDLEEQTKLIPLLQMQIQSLKDEQKQLVMQLEASRAPSSSSSSSPGQQHTHFQIHRVSPVSLSSMKLNTNVLTKRNVGTNTAVVYQRDIGIMSEKKTFSNAGTLTEFRLPCDGDGGRIYSEKDLKKTVELVHSKMRKAMVSVGIQHVEQKMLRDVGVGAEIHVRNASCVTDEPHLVITATKSINIEAQPTIDESVSSSTSSLSLKDMSKLPITRNNTTQTTQGAVHHQMIQVTPYGCNKGTDSIDLIRTVHRATGTELIYKKDQTVNTSDLIRTQNSATNTIAEPKVTKRTTSSNTDAIIQKTIGVNYEPVLESSSSNGSMTSKIPRPSPSVQRKFNRQDTFTVSTTAPISLTSIMTTTIIKSPTPSGLKSPTSLKSPSYLTKSPHLPISGNPSSLFEFRKTPERIIVTEPDECPVEKVFK